MNIDFSDVTLQTGDMRIAELERIMMSVVDGWHAWMAPDPEDAPMSPYFEAHSAHFELALKSYKETAAYGSGYVRSIKVSDAPASPTRVPSQGETPLSISEAAALLSKPLVLWVENGRNDKEFLLKYLNSVAPDLVALFQMPRPPIEFLHGGGKDEIARTLSDMVKWFSDRHIPPRFIIVIDSDSKFPTHGVAATNALQSATRAAGATCFVLEKRAIENYLTDEVLRAYSAHDINVSDSVTFVLSLSQPQRDHFHMKRGVNLALGGMEEELYAGVNPLELSTRQLPNAMNFFLNVYTEELGIDDLRSRGCGVEFGELAELIRSEL